MEKLTKNKNVLFAAVLIVLVLIVGAIALLTSTQQSGKPFSEMKDGQIILSVNADSNSEALEVGDRVSVNLSVNTATGAGVSEVVLNFPAAVLEATSINEEVKVLALNKSIDNNSGVITVDIANAGPGNFPNNSTLVNFEFTVKADPSGSVLSVAKDSTLGLPDILSETGYGSVAL